MNLAALTNLSQDRSHLDNYFSLYFCYDKEPGRHSYFFQYKICHGTQQEILSQSTNLSYYIKTSKLSDLTEELSTILRSIGLMSIQRSWLALT